MRRRLGPGDRRQRGFGAGETLPHGALHQVEQAEVGERGGAGEDVVERAADRRGFCQLAAGGGEVVLAPGAARPSSFSGGRLEGAVAEGPQGEQAGGRLGRRRRQSPARRSRTARQ